MRSHSARRVGCTATTATCCLAQSSNVSAASSGQFSGQMAGGSPRTSINSFITRNLAPAPSGPMRSATFNTQRLPVAFASHVELPERTANVQSVSHNAVQVDALQRSTAEQRLHDPRDQSPPGLALQVSRKTQYTHKEPLLVLDMPVRRHTIETPPKATSIPPPDHRDEAPNYQRIRFRQVALGLKRRRAW